MPNWCENVVSITAPKEIIDGIEAELSKEEGGEFLNHLHPIGEWDYDKCVTEWGTKWDATVHNYDRKSEVEIEVSFDTAWAPPLRAYEAFLDRVNDPNVSLMAHYFEPGMCFTGYFENGIDEYYEWEDKKSLELDVPEWLRDYFGLDSWYDYEDEENEDDT